MLDISSIGTLATIPQTDKVCNYIICKFTKPDLLKANENFVSFVIEANESNKISFLKGLKNSKV